MNTTTATRKIKLTRVLNGWYSYNTADYSHSFEIHKIGTGAWSIKHQDWTAAECAEEAWIVEDLDKARSFIASTI